MKKTAWFSLSLLLCLTVAVSAARADSQTWYFTGTNSPANVPCSTAAPCGEVNITTSGNFATFTVSSLLSGYIFDTFGFNYSPNVFAIGNFGGEVSNPFIIGNEQQDGWGSFGVVVHTGLNGGSRGGDCVVTGGVPGAGCTFTFQVECHTNCLLSDFEISSSGGAGSGFFAGHLAAGGGLTGYVGAPSTQIDEPASLSVIGSGLLMLAGLLRRRIFGFLG